MKNMFGKNKKYNILVLGNNGMLGHELYETFVKLSSNRLTNIGTVIGIDVKDGIDLTKCLALGDYLMNSIHFDYCINCVAHTDTKAAETTKEGKELDYKLNALAPKYIAETCKKFKTKLIHISTDYVFSEKSVDALKANGQFIHPFKLDSEPFPINVYGINKLLGEKFIEEVFGKESKDYAILRVSWLYGSWNSKSFIHKFLKNVVSKLKEDPNAKITMTSNEVSVPTSVAYVIECIKDVINNKKYGVYHAVPLFEHSGVSRFEFAQTVLEMLNDPAFDLNQYTINGKALKDIKLEPVEYNGYQPKYSAMKNDFYSNDGKHGIGYKIYWKEDLKRFMVLNAKTMLNILK